MRAEFKLNLVALVDNDISAEAIVQLTSCLGPRITAARSPEDILIALGQDPHSYDGVIVEFDNPARDVLNRSFSQRVRELSPLVPIVWNSWELDQTAVHDERRKVTGVDLIYKKPLTGKDYQQMLTDIEALNTERRKS